MRRFTIVAALSALSAIPAIARAQDPGASVPEFDKKRGGSEKMHRLARIPAHDGRVEGGRRRARAGPQPAVRLPLRLRELRRHDLRHQQHVGAEAGVPLDHRKSRAASRHRRDGREVLQDQRALLLRAVAPVQQGTPRRRPRRRHLRRDGAARSRRRSRKSRASSYPAVAGRVPQHVRVQALRRSRAVLRDDQSVEGARFTTSPRSSPAADPATRARRRGAEPDADASRRGSADTTTSTSATIRPREQDKFYGAGLGGYSVCDVTKPEAPKSAVHHHESRHRPRAHVHAVARRSLCGDRDRIPVHAAPHLGSRAGSVRKDAEHRHPDQRMDVGLARRSRTTMKCAGRSCSCPPTRTGSRCST